MRCFGLEKCLLHSFGKDNSVKFVLEHFQSKTNVKFLELMIDDHQMLPTKQMI
jgi:hypothetical protein